jgi:beta-galactosidase
MINRYFYLLLPLIFSSSFYLCSDAQSLPTQKINFDTGWKFHFGHAANAEKDFNYSIVNLFAKSGIDNGTVIGNRFDDSKWTPVALPHDWAVGLPFVFKDNFEVLSHGYKPVGGLFPETSIGWYRKHFLIDKKDSGNRFQIQFDGIYRNAEIWLNGFYLGNNKSGYIGQTYDITDYIRFSEDNAVVVRADATQYEGWFYEGAGIYRHSWLLQNNNLHLVTDGVYATSKTVNHKSSIHVISTIENKNDVSATASVIALLKNRSGITVARSAPQNITCKSNATVTIQQNLQIMNPRLWSLTDPYLYHMVVEIKMGEKLVDTRDIRLGIREIRIEPKGVFLNDQHIKIYGVNNHQDHAGVGSALPDYLQYYRVGLLKNMGVNACRTSHHPPTPEFLDACDSLGMLVLDENRFLNSSPEYMNQFERMLLRDRNRASVFLWSIANEEGWIQTGSTGKRIAQSLIAKQKELDPSRTCTYAADVANVFKGINEVIPVRGFNYRESAVDDYHRDHPNQPIIGTEMGSTVTTRGIYAKDSIRGYLPDQDITAPWWASTAEKWWKLAAAKDYWLGGFVWTGFDYRGEPTPFQWPNINSHFGIMDMCGFPKNIYYYYQSWWTDKDVLHISPHWNWKEQTGKPVEVWVNSNAEQVELFLNGKTLGKKEMPRNGHLNWIVNFEPGKLEATGWKKGKILKAKIETTDLPAEVVVTPYKTTILADGKDVTVLNISVVDREGREVPDAGNTIRFYLSGDARIIGVGNGDPSSHEPDQCVTGAWQRNLFNGKCQVLVQSNHQAGMVKFEAKSPGLWTGSTDISLINQQNQAVQLNPSLIQSVVKKKNIGNMIGADISFLPELEEKGIRFSDSGKEKDAVIILKEHGFNYIRLRIFNDPANPNGYSPVKGFCDLAHTLKMAKRIKAAGLKLLLDFHYSDTWADPGKQFKPEAWKNLPMEALQTAMYNYTKNVLQALKDQGTLPNMVQIGNEINHGIVWPEGNINNFDQLAALLKSGIAGVHTVDPAIPVMMHLALGGQNDESKFFINNLLERNVNFDVIGLSYYPKWHGTLDDLRDNMNDLSVRYDKDIIIVEYSALKKEVNTIAFGLEHGKGTCIWEPLNTWEAVFDRNGKSNEFLLMYDDLSKTFLQKK